MLFVLLILLLLLFLYFLLLLFSLLLFDVELEVAIVLIGLAQNILILGVLHAEAEGQRLHFFLLL